MATLIAKVLIGLSALAFALAVLTNYVDPLPFPATTGEEFSRASANMALLAIALVLPFRDSRAT